MIFQEAYIKQIMKPIFHPPMAAITLEGIFHALSDPARTAIFANIAFSECPQNCTALAESPIGQFRNRPFPSISMRCARRD